MSEYRWHVQRSFGTDTIQLLFCEYRNGKMYRAKKMEFVMVEHDETEAIPEPTMELPRYLSQPFLDSLAEMLHNEGIKPKSQSFVEGEIAAMREHLSDMRKLVFKP